MGKLIIIEAGDGSGKATQTQKLFERLNEAAYKVKKVSFPNYDSPSSSLIKMYLSGAFGEKADDVNPFVASTFYAVDRFASFKTDWESFYNQGGIILADRYTTSNMVHQASKIKDETARDQYLEWLRNFEFELFQLPEPDLVLFLDMPPEYSRKLMAERNNKFTGEAEKDIHEKDAKHLEEAYCNAKAIARKYGWVEIPCTEKGHLKSIDEIHQLIYEQVSAIL